MSDDIIFLKKPLLTSNEKELISLMIQWNRDEEHGELEMEYKWVQEKSWWDKHKILQVLQLLLTNEYAVAWKEGKTYSAIIWSCIELDNWTGIKILCGCADIKAIGKLVESE